MNEPKLRAMIPVLATCLAADAASQTFSTSARGGWGLDPFGSLVQRCEELGAERARTSCSTSGAFSGQLTAESSAIAGQGSVYVTARAVADDFSTNWGGVPRVGARADSTVVDTVTVQGGDGPGTLRVTVAVQVLEHIEVPGTHAGAWANAHCRAWLNSTFLGAFDASDFGTVDLPFVYGQPMQLSLSAHGRADVAVQLGNGAVTDGRAVGEFSAGIVAAHTLGLSGEILGGAELVASNGVRYFGSLGVVECAATANSTGNPATLEAEGSELPHVRSLLLASRGVPSHATGIYLVSTDAASVPMPGGSAGTLCLGGAIGRFVAPGQILDAGVGGEFALTVSLDEVPTPLGTASVSLGDTWRFQGWFRDPQGSGNSNFTDGLAITW